MQAEFSLTYLLSHWELWTSPAIGLLSAGLTLFLGRAYLERKRPQAAPIIEDRAPPAPADPFTHGSATEKRSSIRRKGRAIKVIVADAETHVDQMEGWVVDRSVGGLRIAVNKAFPAGALLSIRAANAPSSSPWVDVQVRNIAKVEGRHEFGCQFLRTPPWGVLLLFG